MRLLVEDIKKILGPNKLKLIDILLFLRLGDLRLTLSVQTLSQLCQKRILKISPLVLRYVSSYVVVLKDQLTSKQLGSTIHHKTMGHKLLQILTFSRLLFLVKFVYKLKFVHVYDSNTVLFKNLSVCSKHLSSVCSVLSPCKDTSGSFH